MGDSDTHQVITPGAKSTYKQLGIGLIAISGAISSGLILGFSAVSLPQLTSLDNDDIYLNLEQASWFASLTSIVSPIGCLLCGPILDRFGRKICLLLINIPCLIGWVLLATAFEGNHGVVAQLYCGRIVSGLAVGMASIPGTVYLAEIAATHKLRSMLVTWTSVGIAFGILAVYIFGAIFQDNWRAIAAICGAVPIVAFTLTYVVLPESPLWLISKNQTERALTSLKSLRGVDVTVKTPPHIQVEFNVMVLKISTNKPVTATQDMPMKTVDSFDDIELTRTFSNEAFTLEGDESLGGDHKANVGSSPRINEVAVEEQSAVTEERKSFLTTLKSLQRPEAMKPLIIMIGMFFFQQFSGIYVVIFYAVDILIKAGVTIDAYLATVLVGLVQFLSGIGVSFALKRYGRRPMSIASGIGMTLSLIGLGLYLQLQGTFSWFPLGAILAFVIFGMVGFHTIPWALLGEMYPLDVKGVAAGLTTCIAYIFNFGALKLYPTLFYITDSEIGIFYFYGTMSFLGTLFVLFFLPETHKKSLLQIQRIFEKQR